MKILSLNHAALRVKDATKSADFYHRYCGMDVIHSRVEAEMHVKWIRQPQQKDFMLVLLESLGELSQDEGNMDHLGFYVESRKDVDEIAAAADEEGILLEGPVYAGGIVGYYCMILDPDGYILEFSCEQLQV